MKISKFLLATGALVASFSANAGAQVTGSFGGPLSAFLGLSAPSACTGAPNCTLFGAGFATILGGSVQGGDLPFADIPAGGAVFQSRFLAAGPSNNGASTMTFNMPIQDIGFLWGSPDRYNRLRVNTTGGFVDFTALGMSFPSVTGDQTVSTYVRFKADAGLTITSLVFDNNPSTDAFEAANFTSSTVPEPSTYALMAAGLAALAFASKRRKLA